jgi:hypothetical protein
MGASSGYFEAVIVMDILGIKTAKMGDIYIPVMLILT